MANGIINLTSNTSSFESRISWSSTFYEAQKKSTLTLSYQVRRVGTSGTGGNISKYRIQTTLSRVDAASLVGSAVDYNTPSSITVPNSGEWVTLHSTTHTVVNHATTGNAIVSVTCTITGATNSTKFTASNAMVELDKYIKWAVITSASNFTDEENPRITFSNPSGTSATSLQACIANSTGGLQYVKYKNLNKLATSYVFVLTDAERAVLREAAANSNTLDVRFYIKNEIDGETYTSSLPKIMTIVNAEPVITASVVDTNATTVALTGDSSKLIKYYSNATVSMTATPQKGAAMNNDLYIIRNGNNTAYSTSGTFNAVESNSFTFTAEDSRGNVASTTITPTMVNYIRLTCNLESNKPDANGNITISCHGNYFNGSFGAASNTLTVKYRYKQNGGSFGSWATMSATKSGNTYTATASVSGLDYTKAYVFQCQATDKLATVNSGEDTVRSIPIFHWGEEDFVFEVPVTFNAGATGIEGGGGSSEFDGNIEGDCNITGNLRLKGSGNYGNTLYFGDGSYCYLTETTDDDLTIKSSDLNLNVSTLNFNNRSIAYGTWTPSLSSSAVSSYSVQQGWYQKLGSVVTVGWQIKANINSGYNSTSVSITGLPYTPAYDASGGGMCSGAYISGGFNFECWVVGGSGTITARVQACNNTSAANLSTSASGCFYRLNGGEMTLGGTVSFLTNG
jgi:hypothetical protein